MKLHHIVSGAIALAAAVGAQALPMVTSNLGTDPVNAPVMGFAAFSSATSTYNFNLSSLGSFSGSLFGYGALNLGSVLVDSTPTVLTSAGSFSVAGLSAGAHTFTINFSSPLVGGFGGYVTATPVPEPAALLMGLSGVAVAAGVAVSRRRRVVRSA